ncbi:IS630 family transposase, partial [Methylobacterium sp. J-001]|nr:IS630 family transposase [Methylobacterium sp. J-001]MCJ2116580.1 IS630 family transposase [Methylobacterium sp. J-001]
GVVDLQVAINRYIAEHNRYPRPFISTESASATFDALSRTPKTSI